MSGRVLSTLFFERVGDLQLIISGKDSPSASDWLTYVASVRSAVDADNPAKGLLAFSDGGGPNSVQRKQIVDAFGRYSATLPVAICTSSVIARGITTAISWISPAPLKSFEYDDVREAYAWTKAGNPSFGEVLACVRKAQQVCGFRVSKIT